MLLDGFICTFFPFFFSSFKKKKTGFFYVVLAVLELAL